MSKSYPLNVQNVLLIRPFSHLPVLGCVSEAAEDSAGPPECDGHARSAPEAAL